MNGYVDLNDTRITVKVPKHMFKKKCSVRLTCYTNNFRFGCKNKHSIYKFIVLFLQNKG